MKLPDTASSVIDELGEIEETLKPYDDLVARRKALRAQVLGWAEELAPDEAASIDGERFAVQISERSKERKFISMRKLYKAVGLNNFLAHCSFTLKAAQLLLSGSDLALLVKEERTGSRSISTVPRQCN
jgi:hypothetical protein